MNRLLIWLLERQIKNGWMPRELFYASARMFGESCLELYIYRYTPGGREQVYLIPRPDDDPFYPAMLHLPGVRKIPTETDTDHLRRALSETYFDVHPACVRYVASGTIKTLRGTEYSDVRRITVAYEQRETDFYDVDDLPSNIIEHHKEIIRLTKW